jgi:hypothetical protein
LKFEVGKIYKVNLGRKHSGSIIRARYIEYREKEDSHVVQPVSIIRWCGSIYARKSVEEGVQFIVGEEQISEE